MVPHTQVTVPSRMLWGRGPGALETAPLTIHPFVCLISSGNRRCLQRPRMFKTGLLAFCPPGWTLSPCFAPPLWRKVPGSFVSKSTLFRASQALADSGQWELCPVPPRPELCQEGTQASGGGP